MAFSISEAAFAKDQLPNAEVYLGSYSVITGSGDVSDFCTATQSHVNLRVNPSSGSARALVQYRKPNGTWTSMGSTYEFVPSTGETFNVNAVKGNDYRVKLKAGGITGSGTVVCY